MLNIKNKDNKNLLSNFISLIVLQGLNIVLPLITMPYLVIVLGTEYFGLLAFATAIISYFSIITNYGFNITATREISIHRGDDLKLIEIFSSVMTIKFLLMIVSFLILLILVFSFDKFIVEWEIYLYTFGIVAGQVFFPVWFFQGMEKMKYITYLNVLTKTIFTIAVFLLVKAQDDYFIVPILTSFGFLISGILSLRLVKKKFNVKFKFQKFAVLKNYAIDGWYIFISNISVSMYTMTTTVILGFFTNNIIVGYYSIADKLINALKQLIAPVSQALYPFISRKAEVSKKEALKLIKKAATSLSIFSFICVLFLFFFAENVFELVFGEGLENSILIFKILALIPFLVVIDTVFGTLLMLVFKRNKEYSRIIISAGLLNLFLAVILIPLFEGVGAAVSVLIVEVFITVKIVLYIQNSDLKIIGNN